MAVLAHRAAALRVVNAERVLNEADVTHRVAQDLLATAVATLKKARRDYEETLK
jgi:hypothetical protein